MKNNPAAQPSLAEMTTKAIDILVHASKSNGDKGFFLIGGYEKKSDMDYMD